MIYKRTGEKTYGFAGLGEKDHVVLWAGTPNNQTPWEYNKSISDSGGTGDYSSVTPFYVTSLGKVKCSNIEATGGTIGPCSITEKDTTITSTPQTFGVGDFKLSSNGAWVRYDGTNSTGEGKMSIKGGSEDLVKNGWYKGFTGAARVVRRTFLGGFNKKYDLVFVNGFCVGYGAIDNSTTRGDNDEAGTPPEEE